MTTKTETDSLIAERLREAMKTQERSVAWVARKSGMSERRIARRLKGEVSFTVDELATIADALGLHEASFMPAYEQGSIA
jgi:transcriptional regulator with XRE-family HTH domain